MKNIYKKGNYVIVENLDVEKYPYSTVQIFPLNTLGVSVNQGSEIITVYTSANSKVVFAIVNSQLTIKGVSYSMDVVAEKLMNEFTGSTGGGSAYEPTSEDGSITIDGNDISVTWLKALEGVTEPLTLFIDDNGVEHARIGDKVLMTNEDAQFYIYSPTFVQNEGDTYWTAEITDDRLVQSAGKSYHIIIDWHNATSTGIIPSECRLKIHGSTYVRYVYAKNLDGTFAWSDYVACNGFGVYNLYVLGGRVWWLYDANILDLKYIPSRSEFNDLSNSVKKDFSLTWTDNEGERSITSPYSDYLAIKNYVAEHGVDSVCIHMVGDNGAHVLMTGVMYVNGEFGIYGSDGQMFFDIWDEDEQIAYSIYSVNDGYATQDWVNTNFAKKGDSYTKAESDEKYLTEHQPIKTINNQSIIGEGNIEIESGSSKPKYTIEYEYDEEGAIVLTSTKEEVDTIATYLAENGADSAEVYLKWVSEDEAETQVYSFDSFYCNTSNDYEIYFTDGYNRLYVYGTTGEEGEVSIETEGILSQSNIEGYATQDWVEEQNFVKNSSTLSKVITINANTINLNADDVFVNQASLPTMGVVNNKANKTDVYTKTESDARYATQEWVNEQLGALTTITEDILS